MAVDRDDDEGISEECTKDDGGEDQRFEEEDDGVGGGLLGRSMGGQR